MAANYVKFRRGTPEQFADLAIKADDTLYFIFNEGESQAKLYLGKKLVACGQSGDSSSVTTLAGLTDVLINENLANKDVLIYNGSKWVNESLTAAISVMIGATETSGGIAGLVPAPDAGSENRYLRADGKWVAIEPEVTQIENTAGADHSELMPADASIGDILIIKDVITDGKYQHTAYVYAEEGWAAMDGNYNADNVYFNKDFVFTKAVGVVEVGSSGSTTVEATGKNVTQFLSGIFAKEANPTVAQPNVGIKLNQAGSYEVGSEVTPSYTVTFNAGSYTYGPATGVTATYKVTDTNANSSEAATGSFEKFTVTDSTSYKVSVVATHTAGVAPKSNLGNEVSSLAIKEGTKNGSSNAVTGYRNSFYGTTSNKDNMIDSALIRDLSQKSGKALANGNEFTVNVPVGAMRVIIAYPATLQEVSSIKNVNGLNAESKSAFKASTVSVEGANGYDAIDYRVYVAEYAEGAIEANTYTVKI